MATERAKDQCANRQADYGPAWPNWPGFPGVPLPRSRRMARKSIVSSGL
jgi:hypothetical protein